jgi:Arc/MetJ-type ribon-helix-helix transcriptional regulator
MLREDQVARIEKLVTQGAYPDPAAALDDALTLAERKARLRALVQEGVDDLEAGRIVDFETAFAEARRVVAEVAAGHEASAMP